MKKSQKGFTIIEVALVLAIGALIFLVVFLAVPALQRNQRNDARKRDVSSVVEAISDYSANNPSTRLASEVSYKDGAPDRDTGLGKYLDTLSTNTDTVTIKAADTTTSNLPTVGASDSNTITIYIGKKCKGNESLQAAGVRSYAVVGVVENASGYTHYCSDAS